MRRLSIALLVLGALVVGQRRLIHGQEKLPAAPGSLVDIDRGRRLHVRCQGKGRPTVIMEAGGTHDASQYDWVVGDVAAFTRGCAYDRAGMGFSDPADRPRNVRAMADDLAALLEEARIEPPWILVGGSAGGLVVDLFAREHPADVVGLVLLDAASDELIARTPAAGARMERRACLARSLAHLGVLAWLDPLDRRGERAEAPDLALRLTYRRAPWDAICSLVEEREASLAQLRAAPPLRTDMPLVALVRDPACSPPEAAEDQGVSEPEWHAIQEDLVARSTRGALVVAEKSGHHIATDRPDLVVEVLRDMVTSARRAIPEKRPQNLQPSRKF